MLLRTLASRSTIARRALATAKPPDPKPHTMPLPPDHGLDPGDKLGGPKFPTVVQGT